MQDIRQQRKNNPFSIRNAEVAMSDITTSVFYGNKGM